MSVQDPDADPQWNPNEDPQHWKKDGPARTLLRLSTPSILVMIFCPCSVPKLSSSEAVSVVILPLTPLILYSRSPEQQRVILSEV